MGKYRKIDQIYGQLGEQLGDPEFFEIRLKKKPAKGLVFVHAIE